MSTPRVLMLTRLFPNSQWPTLGTFCAERARALSRHADVRVISPVPWFPRWLGLEHLEWGSVALVQTNTWQFISCTLHIWLSLR